MRLILLILMLLLMSSCNRFELDGELISSGVSMDSCISGDVYSGDGTIGSPYLIDNKFQLNCVRYHMDSHFRLTSHIDLENEPFEPLGGSLYTGARFSSIERLGNLVTVTTTRIHGIEKDSLVIVQGASDASFNVNRVRVLEADDYSFTYENIGPDSSTAFGSAIVSNPFLGVIDGDGFEVRNLVINKTGSQNVGFVSMMGFGAEIKNLTFRNVAITHNLTGTGIISGCMFCFNVGDSALARPIVSNVNVINATVAGGYLSGGITGYATGYSRIADVTLQGLTLSGGQQTGGVVGSGWGTVLIARARVEGDVSNTSQDMGGIAGYAGCSNIIQSSFVGTLTGPGPNLGGVSGFFENRWCDGSTGNMTDSFAHAEINSAGARIGGLVGFFRHTARVIRSYSFSTINTTLAKGGCVGIMDNGAAVESCYYNDSVHVDIVPKAGETALTPAEMLDPATNMTFLTDSNPGVWNFVNGFLPDHVD
jgi:hypothetical protein